MIRCGHFWYFWKGLATFTQLVKGRRSVTWFWHFWASDFHGTFTRSSGTEYGRKTYFGLTTCHSSIREADMREKCSFFNIVQKAFDPPPLSFEHHVVNFLKTVETTKSAEVYTTGLWHSWELRRELLMFIETNMKYVYELFCWDFENSRQDLVSCPDEGDPSSKNL